MLIEEYFLTKLKKKNVYLKRNRELERKIVELFITMVIESEPLHEPY